jgi:hypothetical protein
VRHFAWLQLSSLTPSCASSRRTASLSPDALAPLATPATGSPEEFAAFFAAETRKWEAVVKTAHVTPD